VTVLVTGGAGFVGSHLVDALLAAGHQVRVVDSLVGQVHDDARPRHLDPEAELLVGDVGDRDLMQRALEGVSVVFHQAAEVGVGQSMYEMYRYMRANTLATTSLLELLVERRADIRKLVVASSMSIYGEGAYRCTDHGPVYPRGRALEHLEARRWEVACPTCGVDIAPVPTDEDKPTFPTSVYAVSKQDQELLSLVVGRAYDIPTVALRYFNLYGPRQALSNPYTGVCAIFGSRLLNDRPPVVFEDGLQTRDFTHVSDVVRANLLAMEGAGADYQAVNVGTGVATSVLDAAHLLARGLGKDIEPEVVGRFREGDIRHCVADIGRSLKLLGFEPQVTLEAGMPELLAWIKDQPAVDRVSQATAELEARSLIR
jgi:dTDP-L-rhamnose 4-epimerase